jgi:hypothetical protein
MYNIINDNIEYDNYDNEYLWWTTQNLSYEKWTNLWNNLI